MIDITGARVIEATSVQDSATLTTQTARFTFVSDGTTEGAVQPFSLVVRRATLSGAPMPVPLFDPAKTYRVTIEEETP